jgi:hypothetical protein
LKGKILRKSLGLIAFPDVKGKMFEIILVTEKLCEICEKTLSIQEKSLRKVTIETRDDFEKLLLRAGVHHHAEIDLENLKIYFYDRSFPGDVHPECIEKF